MQVDGRRQGPPRAAAPEFWITAQPCGLTQVNACCRARARSYTSCIRLGDCARATITFDDGSARVTERCTRADLINASKHDPVARKRRHRSESACIHACARAAPAASVQSGASRRSARASQTAMPTLGRMSNILESTMMVCGRREAGKVDATARALRAWAVRGSVTSPPRAKHRRAQRARYKRHI